MADVVETEVPHGSGIHSEVVRIRIQERDRPRWKVIKRVCDHPPWKFQPHNVQKEIRILQAAKNINVIELSSWELVERFGLYWELHLPLVPLPLTTLLDDPAFRAPSNPFLVLTKSLTWQILSALAYLHDDLDVAHRDIKPSNVLINELGFVKLIDFGVAWAPSFVIPPGLEGSVETEEEYVEPPDKMCCAVASGPYRPPELLFSPRSYDPFAVDMWSFGTLLAEFFTTLQFDAQESAYDDGDADALKEPDRTEPLVVPPSLQDPSQAMGEWHRLPLFDGSRGEIGLAWSIFRVRGTPDETSWPSFKSLPDARSASFRHTPRIPLRTRLPNLPDSEDALKVIDLLEQLFQYEPGQRISAKEALHHLFFSSQADVPLILPEGHPTASGPPPVSLKELLMPWVDAAVDNMVQEDGSSLSRGGGMGSWDDLSD